jgi:hypothetical protein
VTFTCRGDADASVPAQLIRTRADRPPFKVILALDRHVRDNDRQQPLVHINPRDSVPPGLLLLARRRACFAWHYSGSRAPTGPSYSLNSHAPAHPIASASLAPVHEPTSPRAPAPLSMICTDVHPLPRVEAISCAR